MNDEEYIMMITDQCEATGHVWKLKSCTVCASLSANRYGGENCEKCGGVHRKGQICPLYGE